MLSIWSVFHIILLIVMLCQSNILVVVFILALIVAMVVGCSGAGGANIKQVSLVH